MDNVDVKITGNKATITIDLSQRHGVSGSGKSTLVASTHGNVTLVSGIQLSLNAYVKNAPGSTATPTA